MVFFRNKLILAPMAGISDRVFRSLCRKFGADIVVSEMVSSEGIHYDAKKTTDLTILNNSEHPVGIQLFGSDPKKMAEGAKYIEDNVACDFIDINSGCPVPKVVKRGAGSALLKKPKLFAEIIEKMVKSVSLPITVKIRSGWAIDEWVDIEFAKIAQDSGVAAITVHPRSKTMGFSGRAHWNRIAKVKQAVSIPVIGNGDIINAADAIRMFKETGCDSIMIGRGSYGNPWIFNNIKDLQANISPQKITHIEKMITAQKHLETYKNIYGEVRAEKEMKKHLTWYIKGFPKASHLRDKIFRADNYFELNDIILKLANNPNCEI